ncbi:MAG TPA: TIGR01459 family HAD-type hydrolase [Caulobacter sp.]|nr:TIGR01459 family HAD-type hydrolase [Caulobacter sp.]
MTTLPAGLADLADNYDVLLSDVWGVIHNGRESFADACAALARFRAERGPVVLISNSPRPAHDVVPQLDALGVPREAWSTLVTSGDATRLLLGQRAPGPAWVIGPERDNTLYAGLGLSFADVADAAFIACTGPFDDEVETPEDYRERFTAPAARGLTMICANPDRVVQRGSKLIYCGGALADLYKDMGGPVLMAGKPYAPIYDLSLAEAARLLDRDVDMARVLCIGDGVHTDVQGAEQQGLDCLFVARGIHGDAAMGPDGRLSAPAVDALLAAEGVRARYAMADLVW